MNTYKARTALIPLAILCVLIPFEAAAQSFKYPADRNPTWKKFIAAQDDDIDSNAWEMLAGDDSFAQLAAADTLEFVLSQTADSVRVRLTAIRPDSTRLDTLVRVKGTTVTKTNGPVRFYESSQIDSGTALTGTLTIRRATGDTRVSQIAAGEYSDFVGHYFVTPKEDVYATYSRLVIDNAYETVRFQLRWYFDWEDSRSLAGPYAIIGVPTPISAALTTESSAGFPPMQPAHRKGDSGWISLWGKGGTDNMDGFGILELWLFDRR
uniref:Uncharacterized protein n=1 Tax=viral metagenome TaxID=1070528 RepID=A0A6M3LDJ4_9ZZZZ